MRLISTLTLAWLWTACTTAGSPAMSTDNEQLVRSLYTEYFNGRKTDRLAEIVAPEFTNDGTTRLGPTGFAAIIDRLHDAFPDLTYTVEDVVAAGDRVAVRWTWRGTHEAAFRSFAPTGTTVANSGLAIFRVANGMLVRAWIETDRLGFLQSIGAVPRDPAFGPPPAPSR